MLIRWYQARARFWATAYQRFGIGEQQQTKLAKVPFAERLNRIFAKVREVKS